MNRWTAPRLHCQTPVASCGVLRTGSEELPVGRSAEVPSCRPSCPKQPSYHTELIHHIDRNPAGSRSADQGSEIPVPCCRETDPRLYPLLYNKCRNQVREHWIQRITFAAETNAACSRGSANTQTYRRSASRYLLCSLSGGEGNKRISPYSNNTPVTGLLLNYTNNFCGF